MCMKQLAVSSDYYTVPVTSSQLRGGEVVTDGPVVTSGPLGAMEVVTGGPVTLVGALAITLVGAIVVVTGGSVRPGTGIAMCKKLY